jgi:membrane associated rhomboid family serine protease
MSDAASGEARLPASSRRDAESRALVLAAEGIPHRLTNDSGRFALWVDAADRSRAELALETWARENESLPEPPREPEPALETWAGYWLALALLAVYAWSGEWTDGSDVFARGANDARALLAGEWWRPITALFLHANVSHALGNAFSCAVFATLLMRRWGAGMGGALLFASGALGNALAALWQRAHYHSVGASTALFGAIGVLAATEVVRRRRLRIRWGQSWLPFAGGIGLVAMLGTGRGSDLGAHVFGLASGAALGWLAARALPQPPRPVAQAAWGAGALAVAALAWRAALAG